MEELKELYAQMGISSAVYEYGEATIRKLNERFAVIDKSLIWYGSMNLLSNAKEEDSLMRLESKSVAEELLQFSIIKYNTL